MNQTTIAIAAVVIIALAIGGIWFAAGSATTVDNGAVGVVYNSWDGTNYTVPQGFYWINGITYDVYDFNVQQNIHKVLIEGSTGNHADPLNAEKQLLKVEVAVRYHLEPENVSGVFRQFHAHDTGDLINICVDPKVQAIVKAVISEYTSTEINSEYRKAASAEMINGLNDQANGLPRCFITVESVDITDIDFSDAVNAANEARAVANTQLQQTALEAEKAVVKARADYNATVLQAQATERQADAKAYAARVVQQNLTPDYLRFIQLQAWDGHLPTTLIMGGNQTAPNLLFNLP